jgi:hypothetical protein
MGKAGLRQTKKSVEKASSQKKPYFASNETSHILVLRSSKLSDEISKQK